MEVKGFWQRSQATVPEDGVSSKALQKVARNGGSQHGMQRKRFSVECTNAAERERVCDRVSAARVPPVDRRSSSSFPPEYPRTRSALVCHRRR